MADLQQAPFDFYVAVNAVRPVQHIDRFPPPSILGQGIRGPQGCVAIRSHSGVAGVLAVESGIRHGAVPSVIVFAQDSTRMRTGDVPHGGEWKPANAIAVNKGCKTTLGSMSLSFRLIGEVRGGNHIEEIVEIHRCRVEENMRSRFFGPLSVKIMKILQGERVGEGSSQLLPSDAPVEANFRSPATELGEEAAQACGRYVQRVVLLPTGNSSRVNGPASAVRVFPFAGSKVTSSDWIRPAW
jgi:hypothetical protein